MNTTGYVCGFVMGRTGVRAGGRNSIEPIGVICSVLVGVITVRSTPGRGRHCKPARGRHGHNVWLSGLRWKQVKRVTSSGLSSKSVVPGRQRLEGSRRHRRSNWGVIWEGFGLWGFRFDCLSRSCAEDLLVGDKAQWPPTPNIGRTTRWKR